MHDARPHRPHHPVRAREVRRPDCRGQPVIGPVRKAHRLGLVAEGNDGEDRAEDFPLRQVTLGADRIENCGRHVGAAGLGQQPLAAPDAGRALFLGAGDMAQALGQLRLAVDGAHLGRAVERVADPDASRDLGDAGDQRCADTVLNEEARARDADLAGVAEDAHRRDLRHLLGLAASAKTMFGLLPPSSR